jgi:hypothetical protein
VLHHRNDVGKGLVEGPHVGIGRVEEAAMHPVDQRVRGLVRDDVVRQAGEDHPAGHVIGEIALGGLEVAEQQRDFRR